MRYAFRNPSVCWWLSLCACMETASAESPSGVAAERASALVSTHDWTQLEDETHFERLALDRWLPSVVYAAGGRELGLFASWNFGERWRHTQEASEAAPATDLVADPNQPGSAYASLGDTLYKTESAGLTWDAIGPAPRIQAVAPRHPALLWGSREGVLSKSSDGGRSWTGVSIPGSPGCCAYVSASSARRVYVLDSLHGGLYRTRDAGATWTPITPADLQSVETFAVDPRNTEVLYAGESVSWSSGLRKSNDGGETWFTPNAQFGDAPVNYLAVSPVDGRVYLSRVEVDAENNPIGRQVHVSIDQALSFVPANDGLENAYPTFIYPHPRLRCVAYLTGGPGAPYRTLNAGGSCH